MNDHRKYLQPKVVAQLENIELIARLVVEGFIIGLHRSPYHGFSVEFAEHRQYRPKSEILTGRLSLEPINITLSSSRKKLISDV